MEGLKEKYIKYREGLLFFLVFIIFMYWLWGKGSQMVSTGDAEDIWRTITTFYSEERYASYVLYKGFASVYPYVWLYQAAVWLKLNELFFVMVYHALLFTFVTVVGIPKVISQLLKYEAKYYQRVLLPVILFVIWRPTRALDTVMVDLPSCSGFIAAVCCALKVKEEQGTKKLVWTAAGGLLCGFVANISGQYTIAACLVMIYVIVVLIGEYRHNDKKGIIICGLLLTLFLCTGVKMVNGIFDKKVTEPFREQGIVMSDGAWWRNRALVCMMDRGRPGITIKRGAAILENIYGEEAGKDMLQKAVLGDASAFWTPQEYLLQVRRYPIDFMLQYIDRMFLAVSHDLGKQSAAFLSFGYILLWMFIVTAVRHYHNIRDLFSRETWFILAFFSSMIAPLVMTVEMRYALSFHAIVYGIALLGPLLPDTGRNIREGIKIVQRNGIVRGMEFKIPWGIIGGVLFVCICLSYMSAIYAQSDLGINMLYCH